MTIGLVEVVYREREGHAVAVRIEPGWPAYYGTSKWWSG